MIEDSGNNGESHPAHPKNILSIHLFSYVLNYKIFNLRELAKVCWNFSMANQPRWEQKGPSLEVILVSVLQGDIVRYVSDQAAVAFKVRMMIDSC